VVTVRPSQTSYLADIVSFVVLILLVFNNISPSAIAFGETGRVAMFRELAI
jgi:hypothetical protein